jgi:exonuclease III
MALYGPASWRNYEQLQEFWGSAFDYLGPAASRSTVVGGDFNLGLAENDKEIGRTSAWTKCADPFYRGFEQIGYVDAWRSLNTTTREYSYYPPKLRPTHTPHGRRIDHIFVSPRARSSIARCYYDHSFRDAGQSTLDHSGLVLEIAASGPAA